MAKENAPLTPEAQAFADKLYPCEPPCDSFGICENCHLRNVFGAGYNFGWRANCVHRHADGKCVYCGLGG